MAKYVRNIQGIPVELELIEVDPVAISLDATNPRLGFSIRQLGPEERTDAACTVLLTSQEDVEELKRSIVLSGGVQEPVYLRANGVVAEGNRRVAAMRLAKEEYPEDPRFKAMPAWIIPAGTPEPVVQNLLNEIHLGSVRGWAPYEKALQLRALLAGGLIEEEVAERYRMMPREVRQHVGAAELMDKEYFPIVSDPTNIEHRAKFSYFLEFKKSSKLQKRTEAEPDLEVRFAGWVATGRVRTGMQVRSLGRILESDKARQLLEQVGFDEAEEYLRQQHPEEQELYALLEKARLRLEATTLVELYEIKESPERQLILLNLREGIDAVLSTVEGIGKYGAK
jgi:hypothetical protein